jgi:DNA ligase 4
LLSEVFAQAIVQRWEGLVLKGSDDPYFSLNSAKAFIKLKKDYIAGLGDTADFAIVGGHRDARDEQELDIGKLWWTSVNF